MCNEENKDIEATSKINIEYWELERRKLLFPFGASYFAGGYKDCTDIQLQHILYFLIEFDVHYKFRESSKYIMPSTLKTDVLGIQRAFKVLCGTTMYFYLMGLFSIFLYMD